MYLHASSVNVSGQALLFLGHSTAGKSTISKLLSERYPVIADDKVWVCQNSEKRWMVSGVFDNLCIGKGNGCLVGSRQYPLHAVLRIFKSNTVQINPVSQVNTCKYLMDAVFEITFQSEVRDLKVRKYWFEVVAEISRNTQGWRLTFPKDTSIIKNIYSVFEERMHSMKMAKQKE